MQSILFVRIETELSVEEVERRIAKRRPLFEKVPGLLKKEFGREPNGGSVCGIYYFESQAALKSYRESELAATIPDAYEATEVRAEIYEIL